MSAPADIVSLFSFSPHFAKQPSVITASLNLPECSDKVTASDSWYTAILCSPKRQNQGERGQVN
jgi:hypothetical protein